MIADRLSKTVVERIVAADQEIVVRDETLPGFGVRVKPSSARCAAYDPAAERPSALLLDLFSRAPAPH